MRMFRLIKRHKLRKQREQGLKMIYDGLMVQLEQARFMADVQDLPDSIRAFWHARYKTLKYWAEEAKAAMEGRLHF